MSNNKLFSVVIPTKNRHEQLFNTIMAHRFWPAEARSLVELVIVDNSNVAIENTKLREIENIFHNTVYQNISDNLTISENFSRGFTLCSSEWMTFIGDDDFFMPEIIDVLNTLENQNIDCIVYNPDKYYWDNCVFVNKNVDAAPKAFLKSIPWNNEVIDTKKELKKALKNGGLTIEKMPRLYHGLVKRDVAKKKLLKENGEMILGSPDISMATVLSCSNLNAISVEKSLTVYGASGGSGGGMTTAKTHVTPLDKATFLSTEFRNEWDKRIPAYWSEYTVFPASIIFVSKKYNLKLPAKINFSAIFITCLLNESSYYKSIFSAIRSMKANEFLLSLVDTPYSLTRKTAGLLYRRIKKNVNKLVYCEPSDLHKYMSDGK